MEKTETTTSVKRGIDPEYDERRRKCCYILDRGWDFDGVCQDGEHLYSTAGGKSVPLQTAYEIQVAVERGDQHGFGTD